MTKYPNRSCTHKTCEPDQCRRAGEIAEKAQIKRKAQLSKAVAAKYIAQGKRAAKKAPIQNKRIRPVSKKLAARRVLYAALAKSWLIHHPVCRRCGAEATDVHHSEGRVGELLTDTSKFVELCRPCHMWAEEHPTLAKEANLSTSRLNIKA